MTFQNRKKLLLTLDGSDRGLQIIKVPEEFTETRKKEVKQAFDDAISRLARAGIASDRVTPCTVVGTSSRAEAIEEFARKNDCGLIVMGRKGPSRTDEFALGRVTNKVIQLAQNPTLWVVP